MNCQFCEDYEWSKKHRPKTGRELYTKYYVCLYERTLRKGCGLASTYTHKRRPLNFSLKFSAEDRDVLKEYIKDNGKEDLVAVIVQKIRGEI